MSSTRARDVSVLTVDDQAVFRRATRSLVEATDGFSWAGEAASGPEALEAVADHRPDLVLMDMRMPGMGGPEVAERLAARDPDVVVILVSTDGAESLPAAARSGGARAHVRKEHLSPRLLRELWATYGRDVSAGDRRRQRNLAANRDP